MLDNFQKINQWRRWEIFLNSDLWIAIKKALSKEKIASINREIIILKKLNNLWINFVPKIIKYWDWWFQYKRIEGTTLKNFLSK